MLILELTIANDETYPRIQSSYGKPMQNVFLNSFSPLDLFHAFDYKLSRKVSGEIILISSVFLIKTHNYSKKTFYLQAPSAISVSHPYLFHVFVNMFYVVFATVFFSN